MTDRLRPQPDRGQEVEMVRMEENVLRSYEKTESLKVFQLHRQ